MTALARRSAPIVPAADAPPPSLAAAIAVWLDTKFHRSASVKTRRAYDDAIHGFRAALQGVGLDLDGETRAVALAAQGWAGQGDPAPTTFNQRLAILSSFYAFAHRRGLLAVPNPIALIDRRAVEAYAAARPLDPTEVRRRLAAIDRGEVAGLRDTALLVVALQTGRRLAEVASLTWRDVQIGSGVTLTFRRCKGGKTMRDALPPPVAKALLAWLHAHYGAQLGALPPEAPLWVALGPRGGGALSTRQIARMCEARLGTSKVHALRHTFARTMESAGAKVSDIQARLGHASLATTGKYLAALRQAENDQADALAALFGFDSL